MTALQSPAAERNKQPILDVLQRVLPHAGHALEIASGSGQHIAHFSAHMPGWHLLASDPGGDARASIKAWWPEGPTPLALDVTQEDWQLPASHHAGLDLVFSANMLHISPWASCAGLMQGAARHLASAGLLIVYGPFIVPGEDTAPSNLAFDQDLRRRNEAWGLRSLDEVSAQAAVAGLSLQQRITMPANNLILVFSRRQG